MRKSVLGLAIVLSGAVQVHAGALPTGNEFQTNSYTVQSQHDPAIASDTAGNFIVVWTSYLQDGDSSGVFGQRFTSSGGRLGTEFQVSTQTSEYQTEPAAAVHSSSTVLVVWTTNGPSGADVHGQRFDGSGAPIGMEFQVNSASINDQQHPAVAATPQGFIVVWFNPADASEIVARRFDSAGTFQGDEFQVNTFTADLQQRPTVAANGVGTFVVAWESYAQDGPGYGVFGQLFNSGGTKLGTEFQVNTYTVDYQRRPASAAFGSGDFVVLWHSYLQDGAFNGVFGQRFGSSGNRSGGEFQVNTVTADDQDYPALAGDLGGGFTATWTGSPDGAGFGIFGQCFDSAGNRIGAEFQSNSYTPNDQTTPAMASTGGGNFVVAWQSYDQDGSYDGVFTRRFSGGGAPPPPPPQPSGGAAVPMLDARALTILIAALLLGGRATLRMRRRQ